MKWVFYVIVFVYMFYRAVYGLTVVDNKLAVTSTDGDDDYVKVGGHKTFSCQSPNRNKKVDWIDPNGHVVKRIPGGRIFSQEHFVNSKRGRPAALVLTISRAVVQDTGVYQCKAGDLTQNVSLCVIDPSEFADTPSDVMVDLGRSITLTCQAKGDPEPRISWVRNGEVISDEENSEKYKVMTKYNIQGFEGMLTITSLEPEDSGVYSCSSIQESLVVDNCSLTKTFNISLNVNYPPKFKDSEENITNVYAKNNQEIDILCSAEGYPPPTYRWFKDLNDDVLFEYDKKQIKLSEDGSSAILTVVANQSTFLSTYKCQASNEHGESDKYFILTKMEKPKKPSEVVVAKSTAQSIYMNVTWEDGIKFPTDTFEIQYLKVEGTEKIALSPDAWSKSQHTEVQFEEVVREYGGLTIGLSGLEPSTNYWIRLKVANEMGESLWSSPLLALTEAAGEGEDEVDSEEVPVEETVEAESAVADNKEPLRDGSTFFGLIFAGGIFVVAIAFMFAMRMVK